MAKQKEDNKPTKKEDKWRDVEAAVKDLQSRFGEGILMRMGEMAKVDVDVIPTGALSLDMALGVGGVPRGRIIEIFGPESSGKTTLALHIIAEAQKKGGICAFVDAEHALDPDYSKKIGVQVEDLKRMLHQVQNESLKVREESDRLKVELDTRFHSQIMELDEWKRKTNDLGAKYSEVIKENELLRAHQGEELETLRTRNQQLSAQMEQLQRQNREFVTQFEQQDLIQKRMKAASELAEFEAQLKMLVQKQRTLENELHVREEALKEVFAEQDVIERAIVNAKQAQKYLLEQSKLKDKTRLNRPKGSGPIIVRDDETEPEVNG